VKSYNEYLALISDVVAGWSVVVLSFRFILLPPPTPTSRSPLIIIIISVIIIILLSLLMAPKRNLTEVDDANAANNRKRPRTSTGTRVCVFPHLSHRVHYTRVTLTNTNNNNNNNNTAFDCFP
jgi:hypothetical protein